MQEPPAFRFDIVIVGAGAAGIGMAVALRDLGLDQTNFCVLERGQIGQSFLDWPAEMRFITPSFTSNGFGMLDLNAVAVQTSPAHVLDREHPSGPEYAAYLMAVYTHYQLPVRGGVEVTQAAPLPEGGFLLNTNFGTIKTEYLIWATGEFGYPRAEPFPGAEFCLHTSFIRSYQQVEGDEVVVLGGYESGCDAAMHLIRFGKKVTVLDRGTPWERSELDPSRVLSPFTFERLEILGKRGGLTLQGGVCIKEVQWLDDGTYRVLADEGAEWRTLHKPLLATGFLGGESLIASLFDWHPEGYPLLTPASDESTKTPGLFLVGPHVRQGRVIFCFIYKFRQRFGLIARELGQRLGVPTEGLEAAYRKAGMFLDDLTCCLEECAC